MYEIILLSVAFMRLPDYGLCLNATLNISNNNVNQDDPGSSY